MLYTCPKPFIKLVDTFLLCACLGLKLTAMQSTIAKPWRYSRLEHRKFISPKKKKKATGFAYS